jgi:hypothetical protein
MPPTMAVSAQGSKITGANKVIISLVDLIGTVSSIFIIAEEHSVR